MEFGTIQKERNKKVKLKWEKSRNGEKYWWKMFWKNLVNCFGDGDISKGEEEIYKKAKKTRWKRDVKQKAIRRGYYHKLQKSQVNYCLDLSHLSNEKWKEKWKEEITQRFKKLHPTKQKETVYKGIINLHPKEETAKLIQDDY
jgi:hypothetical protein